MNRHLALILMAAVAGLADAREARAVDCAAELAAGNTAPVYACQMTGTDTVRILSPENVFAAVGDPCIGDVETLVCWSLEGPEGPIGETGPQGERGETGNTGPQGAQGPLGAEGPQGIAGLPGPTGPKGTTGPAGIEGDTGPAGLQGAPGPIGATAFAGQGCPPNHGLRGFDESGAPLCVLYVAP